MNNNDIEEDIKILNKLKNKEFYFNSSLYITGKVILETKEQQAIENILADREEKEQYIKKIADMLNIAEDQIPIELGVQLNKANKYDRLAERIKEVRNSLEKDGFIGYADELMDILEEE